MIQKYFIVEFSAGCCYSVDNVDIRVLVLVDNIEMCMGRILITHYTHIYFNDNCLLD